MIVCVSCDLTCPLVLGGGRESWYIIILLLQSKKLKGVTRKSIFATPEAVNGRVGIGTCGIGGKPMTDYTQAEKRRRGM